MPSTYTDSGIELIGDGEQSGAWGATTNVNLQIIDRLISQAGTIALSGTTHTLTVSDGGLSDGQYAVLVFSGSPSGTNTVTVSPNDAKRNFIIRNLSGQTVILTQGSGGNASVLNGRAALVYCDGAGAGAAVINLSDTFVTATVGAIGALTPTDGNFIVGNGTTWVAESGNTALTSLGVTATATELNYVDGVVAPLQTQIDTIVAGQLNITGAASTIATDDLTINRAVVSNASGKIAVSDITTTQLGYLSGVTSPVQTQLNAKQNTITGAATTVDTENLTTGRVLVSDGSGKIAVSAITSTELGYLDNATSNIQGQIDTIVAGQLNITGAASTIVSDNLTASRAVVSDAGGKVVVSPVTSTELGYLDNVTSNIQTQLNAKQPLDAELTAIAALTPTDGNFIVGNGSTWVTESGNTALTSLGVTATATELNYVDGVTSNIQTQLDAKAANTTQTQATWEAGTGTTETIVSPAKVKAAIDALVPVPVTPVGVSQSWASASRTAGVSYQTTTGQAIQISARVFTTITGGEDPVTTTGKVEVSSNGSTWVTVGSSGSLNDDSVVVTAIVPDDHYYRYSNGTFLAILS